jgi:hypothetical protein
VPIFRQPVGRWSVTGFLMTLEEKKHKSFPHLSKPYLSLPKQPCCTACPTIYLKLPVVANIVRAYPITKCSSSPKPVYINH